MYLSDNNNNESNRILNEHNYQITNWKKSYRRGTNSIIISHIRNLWEHGTYIEPSAKIGSYRYTWGRWQRYFYKDLNKRVLPCHYFAELLDKDYVIYQGASFPLRSYFLEDLADNKIIPDRYRDSLLLAIGEDFSVDIFEDRLSDHLCDKLFSGLMREYNIKENEILLLDDILIKDWEVYLKESGLRYDITLQRYFDIRSMRLNLRRFYKR